MGRIELAKQSEHTRNDLFSQEQLTSTNPVFRSLVRASLAWALAALACSSPTGPGPHRPSNAERFDPPPVYREWWVLVETCADLEGDFDAVRWFSVPGDGWFSPTWGEEIDGAWVPPDDIYLAEESRKEETLVKHEILHELLDGGDLDDPRFVRCTGIGHDPGEKPV